MATRPPPDPIQLEARLLVLARMLESATAELDQVLAEIKEGPDAPAGLAPAPPSTDERTNDGK